MKRATVSGGPYTTVAAMTVPANSPGPINYLDLHLNNGTTYFYVVSAVNTAGEGPNSAEVNATPVSPFPSVPTRLNAVQIGNLSQIQLTWAVSVGSSSYNVKRSTVSGGPYTTIASTLDPTTTYTDTPVTYGTIYYYVVSGANIKGESANSTEVSATPQAPPPNVPTGLSAKAASSTAVNLIWQASTDSYGVVSGYNIYRNGVLSASSSTTSYSDTGLSPATTYTYTVSAYDAFGSTSAQSTSAKAVTPPSAPTGLTASPSDAQVALTWNASTGAVSYNVLRLVSGGTWIKIVTGLTQLTYTDTTVINGTYYAYIAQAVSVGGQTANSTSVRVLPDPPKPSTPANLAAVPGDGQVALSWSPSSEATSYTIEGRPSSGTWSVLATGVTLPSYTDTTVSNGTRYF